MAKRISAILLALTCLAFSTQAQQQKQLPDPTPRKEAILKLFVAEFVPISPGKDKFPASFVMGSADGGRDNERPAHKVTFKHPFAMAKYEVTQELYHVVMGSNPAQWRGLRNSVEMVNWKEANEFCDRATRDLRAAKLIAADEVIRLPTEAEWEYCCRAGTTTQFSFGDDVKELGKYAWYKDNSKGYDPPVGKKLPNAWGLYDMLGYVWEWCLDDWQSDYKNAKEDGSAQKTAGATDRVVRGGAYPDPAETCRSAYRHHVPADTRTGAIGFRCVKAKVQ